MEGGWGARPQNPWTAYPHTSVGDTALYECIQSFGILFISQAPQAEEGIRAGVWGRISMEQWSIHLQGVEKDQQGIEEDRKRVFEDQHEVEEDWQGVEKDQQG